jgi:hypothetical protein
MRSLRSRNVLTLLALLSLSSALTACPEKGGADKTTAEPERAEPDRAEPEEEGKAADKKPAAAPSAEDTKPDEEKGGW